MVLVGLDICVNESLMWEENIVPEETATCPSLTTSPSRDAFTADPEDRTCVMAVRS